MGSANKVSGFLYERYSGVTTYFTLRQNNDALLAENQRLHTQVLTYNTSLVRTDTSVYESLYSYQTAEVVKNSVSKENNIITINKGKKQGVRENMAVVSPDGAVGVTAKVSDNYCTVVSILNKRMGVSAKLKDTEYFGSIVWTGYDYRYGLLNEIPNHVKINKHDTIVTSGFSAIFPQGILIGTVDSIQRVTEDNFYDIRIKLSVDFKNLRYVYIIENKDFNERTILEDATKSEFGF